jgi:bifunctional ADP-heptose synthase (sugar kinase/adenylyltransferase)
MAPSHRKNRSVPEHSFEDEASLLKYGLEVLTKAGLTVEQVDRLRNRAEPGEMFDKESTRLRRYATAELLAANLSNSQIAKVFKQSKAVVNADRQLIKQAYVDGILATADQWRAKLLDEQGEQKTHCQACAAASRRGCYHR